MDIDLADKMKSFLKEAFHHTIEEMEPDEEVYARYFSKDYIQHVDGKTLNYDGFVAHMKAQKKVLASAKITFKYMLVDNDKIATIHIVNAVKKDGSIIEAQVNAIIQVKDNKIILCDELTHLIKGLPSDRDLGSRQ